MGYSKCTEGQPRATSPANSAAFFNQTIDLIDAFKRGELGGPVGNGGLVFPTDIVKIKNLTGAARDRGHVVQLGAYLLSTVNFRKPWFEGNTVAEPAWRKYAVLLEPAATNDIIKAQISGVCLAVVDVGHTAHRYAHPVSGEAKLKSSFIGPIEILSDPSGAGERQLFVRLAVSIPIILAKTTGAFVAGVANNTYQVYKGTLGSETAETFVDLPNVLTRSAIATTKWMQITWMNQGLEGQPLEC